MNLWRLQKINVLPSHGGGYLYILYLSQTKNLITYEMNENSLVPWCSKWLQYFFVTPISISLSLSIPQKRESCEASWPPGRRISWLLAHREQGQGRGAPGGVLTGQGLVGVGTQITGRGRGLRRKNFYSLLVSRLLTLRSDSCVCVCVCLTRSDNITNT